MTLHLLKIETEPYRALLSGRKIAEFRRDDREPRFERGDFLVLVPFDPPVGFLNNGALWAEVSHVDRGRHIPDGYAMLSLVGVRGATRGEEAAAWRGKRVKTWRLSAVGDCNAVVLGQCCVGENAGCCIDCADSGSLCCVHDPRCRMHTPAKQEES